MEPISVFYKSKFGEVPSAINAEHGHFNVFRLDECYHTRNAPVQYTRRDYYKIALMRGRHLYHYGDKTLEVSGSTLLFFNPQIPYTFESLTAEATGYFCIFQDAFFSEHLRHGLAELPMYMPGGKPAYMLNEAQDKAVTQIFEKMLDERESDYVFRFDLLRNYVMEIVHSALKLEPSESLYQHPDANARIASVFRELLERQFPIESTVQQFNLRSAGDFAACMNVHPNHLNRALRAVTGKTTTAHIAERLTAEAIALLKHTDWNISEISHSLGFPEPAHFSHFFRKHVQQSPAAFRASA
jgi:AraC family transcriptional activator of pobA